MESPNLNYIQQISCGDLDFEKSLFKILKEEFPIEFSSIKKSFQEQDFLKVSFGIHKIKHKISMLGMDNGFKLATRIEQKIKNGNSSQFADLIAVLERINVYLNNN